MITITINRWLGNWVRFEYGNDGEKWLLDKPFRKSGSTVRFTLTSGKKKLEYFPYDMPDVDILKAVQKKYSNYKFQLHPPSTGDKTMRL